MEGLTEKETDILLTLLGTDRTKLADEIGSSRTIVSKVLSGKRKGLSTRRDLAKNLCGKIEGLIIPTEQKAEQATVEA